MHIEPLDYNIAWFEPSNTPFVVGEYEKLEIGVSLPIDIRGRIQDFIDNGQTATSINPYLEWEIKVVAEFYEGNTLRKTVDGFYYEEFERDLSDPSIENHHWEKLGESYGIGNSQFNFRVRAALEGINNWVCKIKVILPNQTISLKDIPFHVIGSNNPGFVEVGNNKRYLTLGGETFFPVGQNIGWPGQSGITGGTELEYGCEYLVQDDVWGTSGMSPPTAYENFKTKIENSSQYFNFVRTMMVPWCWDFEFEKVGDYTDRLNIAWEMDRFFETCREKEIYVNWSLAWGVQFGDQPYGIKAWDWTDQDISLIADEDEKFYGYKTEFNLLSQDEFMSNLNAIKYYKQKLRYFVSRYGYSTNLAIIEMRNEINLFDDYVTTAMQLKVRNWHSTMTSYIKNELHADQLTAVNYANAYDKSYTYTNSSGVDVTVPGVDFSYSLPTVDVASFNHYTGINPNNGIGLSLRFNRTYAQLPTDLSNLNKPVILGETGHQKDVGCQMCAPNNYDGYDNTIVAAMTGFAGVCAWDTRTDHLGNHVIVSEPNTEQYKDFRPHFKAFSDFMNNIDLNGENFQPYLPKHDNEYEHKIIKKMVSGQNDELVYFNLRSSYPPYKAVGVIQNRTCNEYSMRKTFYDDDRLTYTINSQIYSTLVNIEPPLAGHWTSDISCAGVNTNFKCDDLAYKKSENPGDDYIGLFNKIPFKTCQTIYDNNQNKLNLLDMSNDNGNKYYNTDFYNGFTMDYISSGSDNGNKKRLLYPNLTEARRLVVFKSYSFGSAFIDVYPNPEEHLSEKSLYQDQSNSYFQLEAEQQEKLTIYPNPIKSNDNARIVLNPDFEITEYEVINNAGELVASGKVLTYELSFRLRVPGYYLLVLKKNGNSVQTEKIIVI